MSTDLFDEHRAIIAAVADIARAVERTPRIPLDELSRMRVRLSHLIKIHRIAEEQVVMAPLMKSGAIELLPRVRPVMTEIRQMWMGYSEHIRNWTPRAIEADWDGYARTVHIGLDFVRGMMDREEEDVYRPALDIIASAQTSTVPRSYHIGAR